MILWDGWCQGTPPKPWERHVYHLLLGSQTWWLHILTLIIFHLHKLFTTIWLCSTITQGSCSHSWLLGAFNLYSLKIIIIYDFCLQLFQVIISKWFSSLQNPLLHSHHCPQQNLKDKSIFSAICSIHTTLFMWICMWSLGYCFLHYLKWH